MLYYLSLQNFYTEVNGTNMIPNIIDTFTSYRLKEMDRAKYQAIGECDLMI